MLKKFRNEPNMMRELLDKLRREKCPVLLYGAGKCGKEYLKICKSNNINVVALLDDDTLKQGTQIDDVFISSPQEIDFPQDAVVLVSAYNPMQIINRLQTSTPELFQRVLWSDFYLWEDGLDYHKYYSSHAEEISMAYDLLEDTLSKQTFENLCMYKISRKRELIDAVRCDSAKQYFDDSLIALSSSEIFLDLGAYTGDTVLEFYRCSQGKYNKIIAVEPDESNYRKLLESIKDIPFVEPHLCGVSSSSGRCKFNSIGAMTSYCDDRGTNMIQVYSVDELVGSDEITFLKSDIEGMESAMLHGARRTIEQNHPKLAISVYHCKEDIFHIACVLHDMYPGYKFFLRHYMETPIDTVLYAVS